jgi:hypothetical protein
MTNAIATTTDSDLKSILAAHGDQYALAFDAIKEQVAADARAAHVTNRKARVEAFKQAVANRDRTALAKANKLFSGFMRKVRANAELSENMDEPRVLTIPEAKSLMDEMLDIKAGKDTLVAREEEVKRLVFNHLTEQFAAAGEENPHLVNGSIDVPALGHRFSREAAGPGEAKLNEQALRAFVGEDIWSKISVKVETEVLDLGKLMAEATHQPVLLEHLRRSLKVGEDKLGRLNVRPL